MAGTLIIREGGGAGSAPAHRPAHPRPRAGRRRPRPRGSRHPRRHAAVRAQRARPPSRISAPRTAPLSTGSASRMRSSSPDGDEIQVGGTLLSVHGADAATAPDRSRRRHHPGSPRPSPAIAAGTPRRPPPTASHLIRTRRGISRPRLLFLGPLSIFLLLFSSGAAFFVSLPCAIAAIVLGSMGMRKVDHGETDSHRALANLGRICGSSGPSSHWRWPPS